MKRYGIILATEEYALLPSQPTPYCHNDAQLLKNTLVDYCDYADQDVVLKLLSPTDHIEPTTLLNELEKLGAKTQIGDTVLFYYAGHGTMDSGEAYLVLPNTDVRDLAHTGLALRDISEKLRLPGRICVRVFDACHSGIDVRNGVVTTDAGGFVRAITESRAQGWLTFAACRDDEYSHPDSSLSQGIFTYSLCEAIKQIQPDEDILPEFLKIETCKRVADWSKSHAKQQTPTFNSSISGNIVIAHRRMSSAVDKTNGKSDSPGSNGLATRNLEERILAIQSSVKPGSSEYTERLESIINKVRSCLESSMSDIISHGCDVKVSPVHGTDSIPTELKPYIARLIVTQGVKSLHDIRTEEIRSDDDYPFEGAYTTASILRRWEMPKIEYHVSQKHPWPDSCVSLFINSDGLLPSAILFYYLIPLQIRAILYHGIASKIDPRGTEYKHESASYQYIDISDDEVLNTVETSVLKAIQDLNNNYESLVETRLTYLEKELSS